MLPFAYPVILLLLIPIIAIEVVYLRARLMTECRITLSCTAKANVVTMLLGFPLAWLLFFAIELVLWLTLTVTGVGDHLQWAPGHAIAKMVVVATSAAWMGAYERAVGYPFRHSPRCPASRKRTGSHRSRRPTLCWFGVAIRFT